MGCVCTCLCFLHPWSDSGTCPPYAPARANRIWHIVGVQLIYALTPELTSSLLQTQAREEEKSPFTQCPSRLGNDVVKEGDLPVHRRSRGWLLCLEGVGGQM